MVAKAMVHKWEEPVLAGQGGSGAIFFGGCNLGCAYCQNRAISQKAVGTPTDGPALRKMMEDLIAQGAENIDLITATPYLPTLLEALADPLNVPVVYNTGGYESTAAIAMLEGKVDIYFSNRTSTVPAVLIKSSSFTYLFATPPLLFYSFTHYIIM